MAQYVRDAERLVRVSLLSGATPGTGRRRRRCADRCRGRTRDRRRASLAGGSGRPESAAQHAAGADGASRICSGFCLAAPSHRVASAFRKRSLARRSASTPREARYAALTPRLPTRSARRRGRGWCRRCWGDTTRVVQRVPLRSPLFWQVLAANAGLYIIAALALAPTHVTIRRADRAGSACDRCGGSRGADGRRPGHRTSNASADRSVDPCGRPPRPRERAAVVELVPSIRNDMPIGSRPGCTSGVATEQGLTGVLAASRDRRAPGAGTRPRAGGLRGRAGSRLGLESPYGTSRSTRVAQKGLDERRPAIECQPRPAFADRSPRRRDLAAGRR